MKNERSFEEYLATTLRKSVVARLWTDGLDDFHAFAMTQHEKRIVVGEFRSWTEAGTVPPKKLKPGEFNLSLCGDSSSLAQAVSDVQLPKHFEPWWRAEWLEKAG